ncbi:OmpA family protein [Rubellimicrobium mesophilum]|uniref:OmpA family protein n=1 Tax=Rubellimicrobium mesophilum TaxID=1123067 RepID=UPI00068907FC|nr:OmpA family protein [Rubellimicrobium mesophilum]
MTDEEIGSRWLAQRDGVHAAVDLGASRSLDPDGATRGIEVVHVQNLMTTSDSPVDESAASIPESEDEGPTTQAQAPAQPQSDGVPDAEGSGGVAAGEEVVVAAASPPTLDANLGPDAVVVIPTGIRVDVHIGFAFDSAALADDQLPKLEQLCRVMKGSPINLFRIVGYTDAAGSEDYNEQLSFLRAQEVRRYLVSTCGLSPDRLEAVGLGERFLIDPSNPDAAENRRVEFQALS